MWDNDVRRNGAGEIGVLKRECKGGGVEQKRRRDLRSKGSRKKKNQKRANANHQRGGLGGVIKDFGGTSREWSPTRRGVPPQLTYLSTWKERQRIKKKKGQEVTKETGIGKKGNQIPGDEKLVLPKHPRGN